MFFEYHDRLFSDDADLSQDGLRGVAGDLGLDLDRFEECVVSDSPLLSIQEDLEQGATYGVRGTPAFFINGRVVFGAQSLETFRATIEAALEEMDG
jgi:protein-disulfide isomerase